MTERSSSHCSYWKMGAKAELTKKSSDVRLNLWADSSSLLQLRDPFHPVFTSAWRHRALQLRAAVFFSFFYVFVVFFFLSPRQLKHFNHRTMWDSLVRRNAFLHFSSLPPLPTPPPPHPSLFPPHFVSRVLKSQCKYILRGIYNSGNGGGSGSPVSAAGRRLLGLGWTCLLRLKGKNAKKGLRCRMRTRSSSIEFSSI